MDIDHIDGNRADSRLLNLRLLCEQCNRSDGGRKGGRGRTSGDSFYKTERTPIEDKTLSVKKLVEFETGSAEMAANALYEPAFREWAIAQAAKGDGVAKKHLINAGAEKVGASTQTTRSYLDKLTSAEGPLEEIHSDRGILIRRRQAGEP